MAAAMKFLNDEQKALLKKNAEKDKGVDPGKTDKKEPPKTDKKDTGKDLDKKKGR
jgi:hypothetical protein